MANTIAINLKVATIFSSQTPLVRHFHRLTASVVYGTRNRHWHQWNPGIELKKPTDLAPGELVYSTQRVGEIKPFATLNDVVTDRNVCIIGSGPSIDELDLDSLLERTSFLLNGAIYLRKRCEFIPGAFCVEDERFIWSHFKQFHELVPLETACVFSPAAMRAICEISPKWLVGRPLYLIDSVKKPYLQPQAALDELVKFDWLAVNNSGDVGFSTKPSAGIYPVGTIAYSAFQITASLNINTIGMAGIDLGLNGPKPRFYESAKYSAWSGLNSARASILDGFELGHRIATEMGRKIENYSRISALNEIGFTYSGRFERKQAPSN